MGLLTEGFTQCARAMASSLTGNRDNFNDTTTTAEYDLVTGILLFLMILLIFVLMVFVSKFIWNEVACKYITIIKPVPSVIEILALFLLFNFLFM